jgi:hypothetical protein
MPLRRRPQSVRGIVRDNLELIERNRLYGIAQWATLEQLGLKEVTLPAFRDALYRARQGRRGLKAPMTGAQSVPGHEPSGANNVPEQGIIAPSREEPPSPPRPLRDGGSSVSTTSNRFIAAAALKTHRDFLDLVRSTKDEDIF